MLLMKHQLFTFNLPFDPPTLQGVYPSLKCAFCGHCCCHFLAINLAAASLPQGGQPSLSFDLLTFCTDLYIQIYICSMYPMHSMQAKQKPLMHAKVEGLHSTPSPLPLCALHPLVIYWLDKNRNEEIGKNVCNENKA